MKTRTLLAVGTAMALAACHRAPSPESTELPAATVQLVTVAAVPHVATEEVAGTIRPKLRAAVTPKISASILELLVAPGDLVETDQLLARLDSREIAARLEGARAELERADADAERFRKLFESKNIARNELEEVLARERQARASVSEMETLLSYTELLAPFAGVITRKLADVGDLTSPGAAVLEIEDPSQLQIEADVPEALIARLSPGMSLAVEIPSATARIEGPVAEIAPSANPLSRTFLVKVDLPAHEGLRAGQFARLAVPVAETTLLAVPAAAVVDRGQLEMVFVQRDGRAELRLVKTGKRDDTRAEILSGLEPGEHIVAAGAHVLRDGQPLRVEP